MFLSLLLAASLAWGEGLGVPETSYVGASILQGDTDVVFNTVVNADYETDPNTYAFFEGNTLYVGNSCLLYTSPSPRDVEESRMPSSA